MNPACDKSMVNLPKSAMARLAACVAINAGVLERWQGHAVTNEHQAAKDNEVMVYGPIVDDIDAALFESWLGEGTIVSNSTFRAALNDVDGDVVVRVNSPGGDVMEASGMLGALLERQARGDNVSVVVDGMAASAASFFTTLDDVIASPMASIMIHKAWAYAVGNSTAFAKVQERLETIDGSMAKLYAKKMDLEQDAVLDLLAEETWYSADSALAAGLIRGIVGDVGEDGKVVDGGGGNPVAKVKSSADGLAKAAKDRADNLSKLLGVSGYE